MWYTPLLRIRNILDVSSGHMLHKHVSTYIQHIFPIFVIQLHCLQQTTQMNRMQDKIILISPGQYTLRYFHMYLSVYAVRFMGVMQQIQNRNHMGIL